MITANLMGGLGNQLFQIFTTIAYALRNNKEFKFEYSDILTIGHHRPTYWNNFLSKLKTHTIQSKLNLSLYREPFFQYKTIPESLDNIKFFKENIPGLLEVSIGHALVAESLYLGVENVIQMYLRKLR